MSDQLALREVFFGESGTGKSYAVLCHDESSNIPISSVFQEAHNDGSSPAEFRLMDCTHTLESGKTVAERFNIDLKKRPTIFVSGTVGPPKQVTAKHLKTGSMLVKLLRNMLEPRAAKIETTQDLRTKCLDKDICGLLLKGSKQVQPYVKDAMANLLATHPNVAFASVDTSVLFVRNLEEYLPEYQTGQHRFAVFQKVSGGGDSDERLKTSVASLEKNGVTYTLMNTLVGNVLSGKEKPINIPSLPVIKTRTKKLEEEERAKRARKAEQQKRANSKKVEGDESFFSQFSGENDGSREGRKAERERRRAEHRADHNIREKTPEEIQEMERKRRIRMEEEAAKWNIAPEDAPPEGDYVGEEEIFEEGYEEMVEDGDEVEEDDEEVMDLD